MLAEIDGAGTLDYSDIANVRVPRYRLNGNNIKTRAEAVKFINEAGIVLLFSGDNVPLPDLWSAINGHERQIPRHHHDWALHKTWSWKDEIPERREAWYGKIIRGKPAFISHRDLPAMYALSSNFGELDDYLEHYADGLMSAEAKTIYEVLLKEGPLPTSTLRKASGMSGGGEPARRFERAVVELQADLKIVKAGVSDANRWKYCYVYDLLLRWAPELGEQARKFNSRQAMRHIIGTYLRTSVAAPPALFSRLFGWDAGVTERVVGEMLSDGSLEPVRVMNGPGLTARSKPPAEGEIWVMLVDFRVDNDWSRLRD